jgi:hypothetical protein
VDRPLAGHPGCGHQHGGQLRVPDPPLPPACLVRRPAEVAEHRADHQVGERPARHRRCLPPHRPRRAEPAEHHSGRRRRDQAAADPVQPGAATEEPRPPDRTPPAAHPAAGLGHAAAGRAALLSGRDEDFTLIITVAYTGLRWGEAIGLEGDYAKPDELHVEWQLREVNGVMYRLPPKDDSYRSPAWEPCVPVDLPPFLAELLTDQARSHAAQRCPCAGEHGGSGQYVFLGPDGGHYRRSNYAAACSDRPATAVTCPTTAALAA